MRRSWYVPMGLSLVLAACLPLWAGTIVVDLGGGGDYADIQSAIDEAEDGDTVLVKPGEYVIEEPIDFNRSSERKNLALRSEAGAEKTTIRMSNTPRNASRASVMIFESFETADSVVEGFTLTGGQGTRIVERFTGGTYICGGAIFCIDPSSPTIERCIVTQNRAQQGTIACWYGASPRLIECTIRRNVVAAEGGGVQGFAGSHPVITRCRIEGNVAVNGASGGVACLYNSCPTVEGCVIAGNAVLGEFWANFGGHAGGIGCLESSPFVKDCAIVGNYAVKQGGGVKSRQASSPRFVNCLIAGNRAGTWGGGYASEGEAGAVLAYSTIAGNRAASLGGVGSQGGTNLRISNSIIWGNTPASTAGTIDHCVTTDDPLFVEEGEYDFNKFAIVEIAGSPYMVPDFIVREPNYRLRAGSPCIDEGMCDESIETDLAGNPRPVGTECDIGAYEYVPTPVRFIRSDADGDGLHTLGDGIQVLERLFAGRKSFASGCEDTGDTDDDGALTIGDAVAIFNYLFAGGAAPKPPGPDSCGADPTPGTTLGCGGYPANDRCSAR